MLRNPQATIPQIIGLLGILTLAPDRLCAQEPIPREIRYPITQLDFPNPERGWYHYAELSATTSFSRANSSTLAFLKIRADAYKSTALPQTLLDNLQRAFDQARLNGLKVMPRVAYNDGPGDGCVPYGCDAPKSVILQHIAQLSTVWKRNKDVLNLVDPGFIGGWGEWHSSSNGLDNRTDRMDILFAILDSLPKDRMVYVRYPAVKRQIFGGSLTSTAAILGIDSAFNQSRLARVGHLNDCFLSGPDDVGTYQYGWTRAQEIAFIGGEGRFTPHGGETCALDPVGVCANTLVEMAALHTDHLNRDYEPGVISRWGTQGCLDTISLKLGHRLAVEWARVPDSVKPGGSLSLSFAMRNLGFGELFNPRDVEAVLYRQGGRLDAAVLPVDPRTWSGGSLDTVSALLSVPATLPVGAYRLGLRLADKEATLRRDVRYSIRFANTTMWNPDSGINDLKTDLQLSLNAPGVRDTSIQRFEVVTPALSIRRVGLAEKKNGIKLRMTGEGLIFESSTVGKSGKVEIRTFNLAGKRTDAFSAQWFFRPH